MSIRSVETAPGRTEPTGRLWIVGTPIGNLGDMSQRAIDTLGSADLIACEDTRRTGRLLQLLGVAHQPMIVVNEHTEHGRRAEVMGHLAAGRTVALVSDAGMPLISDPGAHLVADVVEAGFPVEVVPGPTALVTALVLSGLSSERFVFEGFLPRKGDARAQRLASFVDEERTIVFYESPKRIARSLHDLVEVCGPDRGVAVARELTKLHEEVIRGPLSTVVERIGVELRGEVVVVLEGAPEPRAPTDDDLRFRLTAERASGASLRDAVAGVVRSTGAPKRRVYALAIALEEGSGDE